MTNKEIGKYKKKQREANNKPYPKNAEELRKIAEKLSAKLPNGLSDRQRKELVQLNASIHDVLQTELMFNACVSAKRSCRWAAVAATVAAVSVAAAWLIVYLTFKGY